MKGKIIYGLIIGLLVTLSGALYLLDHQKDGVMLDVSASEEVTTNDTAKSFIQDEDLMVVYLTGQVVRPDIYEISEGARLYELIDLAGGFTEDAARDYLNLARFVFDGEMIHVPSQTVENQTADGLELAGISSKVSINQGSVEDLMSLSGIGEAKAQAIVDYRKTNGPFRRLEDIMNVDGIKDAMFNKIKDDITI